MLRQLDIIGRAYLAAMSFLHTADADVDHRAVKDVPPVQNADAMIPEIRAAFLALGRVGAIGVVAEGTPPAGSAAKLVRAGFRCRATAQFPETMRLEIQRISQAALIEDRGHRAGLKRRKQAGQ